MRYQVRLAIVAAGCLVLAFFVADMLSLFGRSFDPQVQVGRAVSMSVVGASLLAMMLPLVPKS